MINNPIEILILYFLIISLVSYLMMWYDKNSARQGRWRIAEKSFALIALAGGSLGIWCAMQRPLFHKTSKSVFRYGIPVLMVLHLLLVLWIIRNFGF